ncbi:MAG: hypothetical protein M3069_27660 [Chloroflexota bacterium]|nr:hypothetical protein [Chloroflexota bacterium]
MCLLLVLSLTVTCVPDSASPTSHAYSVSAYISRQAQIDALPAPQNSVYVQPWRGYLETVGATQFLDGLGIDYNLDDNANHDAAVAALAYAGFRSLRIEVAWNALAPFHAAFTPAAAARFNSIFAACHKYGVTPLILINANSGAPEPTAHPLALRLTSAAVSGSTLLHLNSVDSLVTGHSGLTLVDHPMAGFLFSAVDRSSRTVTLSKPLPVALPVGSELRIDTLRHLPLYPVDTPEFRDTAKAWTDYADLVARTVEAAGNSAYEVELWNELTFGSEFLDINNYYTPALVSSIHDSLYPGGPAWELANETTQMLLNRHPGARVIWGFSNTAFYHTDRSKLPPGTNGQSYHPYHTEPLAVPSQWPGPGEAAFFNRPGSPASARAGDGYIPDGLMVALPEGGHALALSSEQLPRDLLAPWRRTAEVPPGTSNFYHYITEHGVDPTAAGMTDPNQAKQYKAKSVLRMLTFWLNKGITKEDVFAAWSSSDLSWGLLPATPDPSTYKGSSSPDLIGSSAALTAVRNMVGVFSGARFLANPRQLSLDVTAFGRQYQVFPGDFTHQPLWYRDMFTALPFAVNEHRFVVATYVMSYDLVHHSLPGMQFEVTLKNVHGDGATVSYYDPLTGRSLPVRVVNRGPSTLRVAIDALDYPRLLTVDDGGSPQGGATSPGA